MLTLKLEKITGCNSKVSKVGITTLVKVSCRRVSCKSLRAISYKNFPSNLAYGVLLFQPLHVFLVEKENILKMLLKSKYYSCVLR